MKKRKGESVSVMAVVALTGILLALVFYAIQSAMQMGSPGEAPASSYSETVSAPAQSAPGQ